MSTGVPSGSFFVFRHKDTAAGNETARVAQLAAAFCVEGSVRQDDSQFIPAWAFSIGSVSSPDKWQLPHLPCCLHLWSVCRHAGAGYHIGQDGLLCRFGQHGPVPSVLPWPFQSLPYPTVRPCSSRISSVVSGRPNVSYSRKASSPFRTFVPFFMASIQVVQQIRALFQSLQEAASSMSMTFSMNFLFPQVPYKWSPYMSMTWSASTMNLLVICPAGGHGGQPAQYMAQHIAPAFVGRQDAVADHERDASGMVGNDLQGNIVVRIRIVRLAGHCCRQFDDGEHQVRFKIGRLALQHAVPAVPGRPRIDILMDRAAYTCRPHSG